VTDGINDPNDLLATVDPTADIVTTRHGMFGNRGTGDTSGYGGLVRSVALPSPTPRPYGGYFDEVADALATALQDDGTDPETAIDYVVVDRDELTFVVRREHIVTVARVLRDQPDLRFELFSGVSGVHYPDDAGRELRAVYHQISITHNRRVRLEISTPDSDRHIPSFVEV
jgi:NADH-quinone oxidoreductase subunit C